MPVDPLPTKLENEPLVDAVFEMRFASRTSASSVIPGILFTRLEPHPEQIERLPAAEIPSEIRAREPAFRFQPLMRLHWDNDFLIMVGDTSLGLACKMPYPGWKKFKPHILTLVGALNESGLIEQIDRYSMKYVGVIEGKDLDEQIGRIKIDLKLGDYILKSEPFSVRVESRRDSMRHIINLAAPATAPLPDGTQRHGILVDIDSICEHTTTDIAAFSSELSDRSEDIHTRNKEIFFELLTPETLSYLRPRYDPIID